ncbi:metalloregulator ArsR/SmtB family transcription factor [Pendulispora rubella]|uniref:Metalloregulator ArsR/SmtB family transcription factor n=1 Tax=Pendulispora rubella TaxID=2741070 RepID=A0ABZ2LFA3_9BACT
MAKPRSDEDSLRSRFSFEVHLRFELCHAAQILTDPASRVHPAWRAQALAKLPPAFHESYAALGAWPQLWSMIPDVFRGEAMPSRFEDMMARMRDMPLKDFQWRLLIGCLHGTKIVERLIAGKIDVVQATSKLPAWKREWLEYVELYPPSLESSGVRSLTLLCTSPAEFRERIISVLTLFWERIFARTWEDLLPQFRRSVAEKERLFQTCSMEEFVRLALLKIEVEERQGFRSLRGGYRLPYAQIREVHVLPSAFNEHRFWSVYDEGEGGSFLYLPYFDPALTLEATSTSAPVASVSPAAPYERLADPAFIFKALGDSTRFTIATIIAKSPRSSAELATLLKVSRPTISHHLVVLREAGLIDEEHKSGSILLSLRRKAIEELSVMTLDRFYAHGDSTKKPR